MRLPNSGMSATMNAIIIKNWDWKSILTGIIRKKHIKEICGTDSAGDLQAAGQGMEIFLCPEKDRRDQRAKSAPF